MKNIVVIIAGSGAHHDLSIEAGTTASDILSQVNLEGYVLRRNSNEDPYAPNENVYAAISDGEKLYATAKNEVGHTLIVGGSPS